MSLLKPALNRRMALAERVVSLGRRLREEANLRVRQPLAELKYACRSEEDAADVAAQAEVIADELNVKAFTRAASLDDLVRYSYKPNLKTLGPKYGKLLNALRQQIPALGDAALAPLRAGQTVEVTIDGAAVLLAPEDVLVTTEQASDWRCAEEGGVQIALSTALTPALIGEGIARDFVRQVQQLRKEAGLEITDRIRVYFATEDETVVRAIEEWREYIAREVLADVVERRDEPAEGAKEVSMGEGKVWVWIERV